MFYVSEIQSIEPEYFSTPLQRKVYDVLKHLSIAFQRLDTDEAITMDDCTLINKKLDMKMVKTLFLCNRQQTAYYLFITKGDKPFSSKDFSQALGIPRVSFAPVDQMENMLGTKVGAATVFSVALDTSHRIQVVFSKDVASEEWYGCSDGTTTAYMKIETSQILNKFLPFTKHEVTIIEV